MALAGKVFLVTGSTDGIGLHTAERLAREAATVLVHGRDARRVAAAVERCRQAGAAAAHGYTADLGDLRQVRALAADVAREHSAVDALVNNAGVFAERHVLSGDGLELTWAVNVAAPFLLTACLLPAVTGRVVNTSSISAAGSIDWGNLQQERGFSSHDAYSLSKLASQLFTLALARRLAAAGSGVTANCLDPGTVNTKMLAAGWGSCGIPLSAANDTFWLATAPEAAAVSGAYYVGARQRPPSGVAREEAAQERLWALLEQQTGAAWVV